MIQMIFMKNNKVVCHFYGYEKYLFTDFILNKSYYKDNVLIIYPNKNDRFKFEVDKMRLNTSLKYIK